MSRNCPNRAVMTLAGGSQQLRNEDIKPRAADRVFAMTGAEVVAISSHYTIIHP